MTTIPTSSTPAAPAATTAAPAAQSASDTQDRFLKLLVTQLQNQDPMNPMDNSQITSQMAQISTVNGIESMNTTMQGLSAAYTASQSMQAASLIGHQVMIDSSSLQLNNGSAVGAVNLSDSADNLSVTVTDPIGQVVQTLNLGAHASGMVPFSWDGSTASGGQAPDGQYTVTVNATKGGQKVDGSTMAAGAVQSVSLGNAGLQLNLNNLGSVAASQVKMIL